LVISVVSSLNVLAASKAKSLDRGVLKMQFMILFTLHPDKAEPPVPADLRGDEFDNIRSL
jgi:hypothetical protein